MIRKLIFAFAFCLSTASLSFAQSATTEEAIVDIDDALDETLVPAPDFTLKNALGEPVSLSEFQGQWVVLDFWGSWCRWCIKGIPEMKEAYAKYHPKGLEIIGIDCGDTEVQWVEALAQYQLPWVNLYNPDSKDSAIVQLYNIQGYPTKIVIDPQGYIYEVFVGEVPDFYDLLDKIFAHY